MNRTKKSGLRPVASTLAGLLVIAVGWGGTACSSVSPRAEDSSSAAGISATANEASHPVGALVLGESHVAGSPESIPFVSASFAPQAPPAACTTNIDGCLVPKTALCDGISGPACSAGQVCALDDACQAFCEQPCAAACDADEECVVTAAGATCERSASFHAGALTIDGTVSPLSLAPPYDFDASKPAAQGAPFVPGAALEVQAAGSASGFPPFDLTFTATTRVHTSLAMLPATRVWGDGSIPIAWEAGDDSILVTVTGRGGMAQCPAADLSGELEIPRAVINAVVGSGSRAVTLAVTRTREETRTLVPSGSEVTLGTSSTESLDFEE